MTEQETLLKDFNDYLNEIKSISSKARGNYISWARYLMKYHHLDEMNDEEDINKILNIELSRQRLPKRKIYRTIHDHSNFKSTLRRFLPFMQCYRQKMELEKTLHIDEIIDMIGQVDTYRNAEVINEAVRLIVFQKNIILTDEQKNRMTENLRKYPAPGNCYVQHFGSHSNAKVINT